MQLTGNEALALRGSTAVSTFLENDFGHEV